MTIQKHLPINHFKGALSGLRQYFATESPFKKMKNTFYFTLKVVSSTFLLVCFVHLKESTCGTKKTVFYFTLKALFVIETTKF